MVDDVLHWVDVFVWALDSMHEYPMFGKELVATHVVWTGELAHLLHLRCCRYRVSHVNIFCYLNFFKNRNEIN